ncbi:MAG: hypothetical protein IJM59_02810 [Proteobacteria bacterium]|nr:hypothetical protein [Pseudomonadota bacterium]
MKRSLMAGLVALSLGFSTTAMAKDIDAIDLFVGDFVGVASIDFDKLVANKMISDTFEQNSGSISGAQGVLDSLKAAGIDYKKDIDLITVALNEKGHACAAVDAKIPIREAIDAEAQKRNYAAADYNGLKIYSDSKNSAVVLSDKRVVACENVFDIKPIIDNAKAEKPKTLKDRDAAIHKAYSATSKGADIRVGAKMTKYLKTKAASYKLDDGNGKSIGVSDAEAASLSISFSKGLNIELVAQSKSEDVVASGTSIISTKLTGILSDPSLAELGIGFVKDAVKVVQDKKNIKASVKFDDKQMATLTALLADLSAPAPKAAPKAAPKK